MIKNTRSTDVHTCTHLFFLLLLNSYFHLSLFVFAVLEQALWRGEGKQYTHKYTYGLLLTAYHVDDGQGRLRVTSHRCFTIMSAAPFHYYYYYHYYYFCYFFSWRLSTVAVRRRCTLIWPYTYIIYTRNFYLFFFHLFIEI